MLPQEVTRVYFHANCMDGHMAAMAIWYYNTIYNDGPGLVQYLPIRYGMVPKERDYVNQHVLVLDFSFPKEIIDRMIEETQEKFLIIDHHDTAQRELDQISENYKIFDMTQCGAMLTWKWVFGEDLERIPKEHYHNIHDLLDYIEARDLWLEKSSLDWKAFTLGFIEKNKNFDFKKTYEMITEQSNPGAKLAVIGKNLQEEQEKRIIPVVDRMTFQLVEDPLDDSKTIVIALGYVSTESTSDIGDYVLKKFPFVDFYAGFFIDTILQESQFSFRSRGYPANKVAEYIKKILPSKVKTAGGHLKASGLRFNCIMGELPLNILSRKKITRLAKGRLTEGQMVEVHPDEPGAKELQALFPDKVKIVDERFIVIRDKQLIYDSSDKSYSVKVGDIVISVKGTYCRSTVISEDSSTIVV